jgi:hypothetical protein
MVEFSAMRSFFDVPTGQRRGSGSATPSAGARVVTLLLALAPLLVAAPARADSPDWESLADVEVIEVVTRDADGDLRETKVWFGSKDASTRPAPRRYRATRSWRRSTSQRSRSTAGRSG